MRFLLAVQIVFLVGCSDSDYSVEHQKSLANALQDEVYKQGQEFLAKNSKRAEVVTLASGVQYEILKQGTGPRPNIKDTVVVHYEGTRVDGRVFDSSLQRGEPANFPLRRLIKGWQEGLQLMPKGSKWKLYIPANLAYGASSPTSLIPPNSTLIFKLELLDIKAPK